NYMFPLLISGITNYEEYSLIQETVEEKKEDGMGTLKKDRTLLRDERKMEKLKAKLHTDDDLNWLDHSRTFREQGVDENETLLLRRKFFYSDQNVDSRDPVQLNLLYVQEKMKSKNKLVPRLLGITKESVMRVDEKTKDVVQEWPLTTVK
ncbi:hypothetical protein XENOCAPTIV_027718, partial [Xenoophorus captivus]